MHVAFSCSGYYDTVKEYVSFAELFCSRNLMEAQFLRLFSHEIYIDACSSVIFFLFTVSVCVRCIPATDCEIGK
jgi:hypothetical protein